MSTFRLLTVTQSAITITIIINHCKFLTIDDKRRMEKSYCLHLTLVASKACSKIVSVNVVALQRRLKVLLSLYLE